MPKLVISLDGLMLKEVQLTKERTTIGRRPYNDIVIDNLAVSGEHAVGNIVGMDVFVEDLNSTNGTYVNGKAVKKQLLANNDIVEIGKYKLKFIADQAAGAYEKTMILRAGAAAPAGTGDRTQAVPAMGATMGGNPGDSGAAAALKDAAIKVLNGAAAGKEVPLIKVVTTLGRPGVQVASITKRASGYLLSHVEGGTRPMVNGEPVGGEGVILRHGDTLELAGTQMQFIEK
jgi:pSer/pThr/pTyr-binding forkhead associated (FHA) protein